MKALVGAFKQEKALVGAFSVIVQPVVEPMEHYTALPKEEPLVDALELDDLDLQPTKLVLSKEAQMRVN